MTHLADLTSPDVAALAESGVALVVPLGSTEQHGPHLPLSTDTDLAVALCDQLALRRDVVVAPPVAYGSSGEHAGFAGTLSIGQAALETVVVELCRSATDTFARVLLVNGHGGNAEPVQRAVAVLRAEGRDVYGFFPRWEGEPHAGRVETAMQLWLRPETVLLARAEAGDTRPLPELMPLLLAEGVGAVSANGVLGDPRGATADEGSGLLSALAVDLTRAYDAWLDRETSVYA
jgi:mycofactocin system creatininase family protein